MQQREMALRDRMLASDRAAGQLIDINSISTFFTPLIDCVVDQDDGVLAKILPMTACTATSGKDERQFLASRFWIKYIVMCHDPKNINLSQETNINECLLIGTRRGAGEGKPTTFVNLSRYPLNSDDARAIVAAIRTGTYGPVGRAIDWPSERIDAGDWTAVQWYNGELALAAATLAERADLPVAKELYEFGPPTQKMGLAFEPIDGNARTRDEVWMFRFIKEELRQRLTGEPEERWQTIPLERRDKNVRQEERPSYLDEQGWGIVPFVVELREWRTPCFRTEVVYSTPRQQPHRRAGPARPRRRPGSVGRGSPAPAGSAAPPPPARSPPTVESSVRRATA